MERGLPLGAFWVVVEARLEDVLEVLWMARDRVEPFLACQEREWDDARLVRCGASPATEVIRDPVVDSIAVPEKAWEAPH